MKDIFSIFLNRIHLTRPPRLEGAVKNAKMNPIKKDRKNILHLSFFVLMGILAFAGNAYAIMPTINLSPTSYGGDNVIISISGDPNSSVILYYNLNSGMQARVLGNTNYNGFFSTTISGSNY